MMMMLEDVSSVSKKCQENLGSPVASEKTGERDFLYYFSRTVRGIFRRILWIHANFEIINFYTLGRRHVEFWARVKGSKGIVVENIG